MVNHVASEINSQDGFLRRTRVISDSKNEHTGVSPKKHNLQRNMLQIFGNGPRHEDQPGLQSTGNPTRSQIITFKSLLLQQKKNYSIEALRVSAIIIQIKLTK